MGKHNANFTPLTPVSFLKRAAMAQDGFEVLHLYDMTESFGPSLTCAKQDKKWGEVPCAFVMLKQCCEATEKDIIAFCREKMAGFKTPKSIVFGPLPKTATGKTQKFALREWVNQLW